MMLQMGLSQELSLRQELRQNLEQKLEQRLCQQIELKMTLSQYLFQENIINDFINWATENNSWRKFDKEGFKFTYAELPYAIAEPIADIAGPGFAHCQYNPFEALIYGKKIAKAMGDWTIFVVKDMIPEGLIEPVVIHERGEEISLGNHFFASQLEFAYTTKKTQLRKYIKFVDKDYPNKFIDLTQKVLFPILPQELIDFLENQGKRNNEELERAENLIEQYPLPTSVLKLMEKYEGITERFCKLTKDRIGLTQNELYGAVTKMGYLTPDYAAKIVDDNLRNHFLAFTSEEARVISRARAKESLLIFDKLIGEDVYKLTRRQIKVPLDLEIAYKEAIDRKKLVNVIKTTEDIAKEKEKIEEFHTYAVA